MTYRYTTFSITYNSFYHDLDDNMAGMINHYHASLAQLIGEKKKKTVAILP